MSATPGVVIEMFPDHAQVKDPTGTHTKRISHRDLASTLVRLIPTSSDDTKARRRLPFGTIFVDHGLSSTRLVVYVPEHKHKILVQGSSQVHEYEVLLPNIILECVLTPKDGVMAMSKYALFCTSLPAYEVSSRYMKGWKRIENSNSGSSDSKGFYRLPLTNMYEEGYLCLGSNSVPSVHNPLDLTDVMRYYEIAVDAVGNNDLSIRALASSSKLSSVLSEGGLHGFFRHWVKMTDPIYPQLIGV